MPCQLLHIDNRSPSPGIPYVNKARANKLRERLAENIAKLTSDGEDEKGDKVDKIDKKDERRIPDSQLKPRDKEKIDEFITQFLIWSLLPSCIIHKFHTY